MMRLQRVGRRNDPSFRVVVTDKRTGPKSNKHIDILGSYNPKMDRISIDGEKAKEWIAKGVQVSDTVHNILVGQKVIEGKKVNVLPKKAPIVSEAAEETSAEVPAAEAAAENTGAAAPAEVGSAEAEPAAETPTEDAADASETDASKEEAPAAETPEEEAETEEEKKE